MRPVHPGDTAVRLGAFFNASAEFWMNLEKAYELRLAEKTVSRRVCWHSEERRDALALAS